MRYSKAFNVPRELVQDGKPNAYLYDPEDMVPLHSITKSWFNKMNYMKKRFPENRLLSDKIKASIIPNLWLLVILPQ